MANDLIPIVADLNGLPGAPFDQSVVDEAVAALRNYLGWHVAPSRTETVVLDGVAGPFLPLPTLHRGATVSAVRDVTVTGSPVTITGWRKLREPALYLRNGYWPCEPSSIEVDLTHGYASCPVDLRPVVAEFCRSILAASGTLQSFHVDDYGETYDTSGGSTAAHVGDPKVYYRLPRRTR